MNTQTLKSILAIFSLFLAASVATAGSGSETQTFPIDIPAQRMQDALNALARQAGLQVVFAVPSVKGKTSPRIQGTYTPEDALKKLLAGTSLSYEFINDKTIAIRTAAEAASTDTPISGFRLAQNTQPATPPSPGEGTKDETKSGSLSSSDRDSASDESSQKGIPEILVQGARDKTRSLNVDLPRTIDDAKPYIIFDSHTIQTSGATNVQDFLFQRLPMNTETLQQSQAQPSGTGAGFQTTSTLNLRGLGPDQTLILVNGRRVSTVSLRGIDRQPDLNGLPLSAVDHIEVLPSSASGIYGGGAVGGVINIILRRDYAGSEVKVNYADTFDVASPRTRYEFTSGFSLEQGRTNALVSATYSNVVPLVRGDRLDLYNQYRNRYIAVIPVSTSSVPLGSTPNIYSSTGTPLTLKSGGAGLNSPITHLPVGYTGVSSDSGAALRANAGRYNTTLADLPYIGMQEPTNSPMRAKALQFNIRREMSERLEIFFDSSYTENVSPASRGALLSALRIPNTAALNPFNQTVNVFFPAGLAPKSAESKVTRGALGFIMKLPANWQLQGDFSVSAGDNKSDVGSTNPDAAVAAVVAGTLNPFVDTQTYPVDLNPFMQRSVGDFASSLRDISARAGGPLWKLPGGNVTLAASLSSRSQKQLAGTDTFIYTFAPANNTVEHYLPQRQRTDSAYLELTVPVFGRGNSLPGIKLLDFQLAARHEIYRVHTLRTLTPSPGGLYSSYIGAVPTILAEDSRFDSTSPVIGLRYQPVEDLMLRASYSTAFRPPYYWQMQAGSRSDTAEVIVNDPRRNNAPTSIYTIPGGNPDILPEDGDNWNLGLVLTPRAIQGLRLAVDYVRIEKTNNITSLQPQILVDNEATFGNRIIRETPAPGDPFGVGRITDVNTSYMNLYGSQLESVDYSASYTLDTAHSGSFTLSAVATRNLNYQQQFSVTLPRRDYVGFAALTSSGASISFKGNATLSWERGPWNGSWTSFYYGPYKQLGPPVLATLLFVNAQGGLASPIPSQLYHDMYLGYRFADAGAGGGWRQRIFDGVEIQGGIKNVFDTEGPYDAFFSNNGYMSPFARLELRTYWLTLTKRF